MACAPLISGNKSSKLLISKLNKELVTDEKFSAVDMRTQTLKATEFENCQFRNCVFSNAELTDTSFSECEFEACDFSSAKIRNTAFKDAVFRDCKLLGVKFENCNKFLLQFHFEGCQVDYSTFYQLKLPKTTFNRCSLKEADFSNADISGSDFSNCDLRGAVFENTNLEKVDFRTAENYNINLESNRVAKARFSQHGLKGLLSKYNLIIE